MTRTIRIEDILDTLIATVEAAHADAPRNWQNAIEAGYDWIIQQDEVMFEGNVLIFVNEKGETYHVTASGCECKAWEFRDPCRHRAARQLVVRTLQAIERAAWIERATTVRERMAMATREVLELYG